jgi:predicted dienelactone hydrolase
MLGPFEWFQTARVLFQLARFYPELNDCSAPLIPIPAELQELALPGPHEVEVWRQDNERFTFPIGLKNCPTIVFSGGGGDDGTGYELLVKHWASHGFVVLQPVHFDSYQHHLADTKSVFWAHQRTTWDVWGLVLGEKRLWQARCEDISRILDEVGDFEGRIDPENIGVGGYSYGAHIACLLGGAKMRTRQGTLSWRDERFRAVVNISGEAGALRQPKGVWRTLEVPTLFVTGDRDKSVWGRDVSAKLEAFRHTPSGQKQLVKIDGASHFAFSGRLFEEAKHPCDVEAQAAIFGIVKSATTKFWMERLVGDLVAV